MKFLWKSAAMLGLAMAGIAATSAPAQAQHYRGDGWRAARDGRAVVAVIAEHPAGVEG